MARWLGAQELAAGRRSRDLGVARPELPNIGVLLGNPPLSRRTQ